MSETVVGKIVYTTEIKGEKAEKELKKISVESTEAKNKLNKLENQEKQTGQASTTMGNKMEGAKSKINGLGAAAGAFATAQGLQMFNTVRNGVDDLAKMGDAIGLDTEELYGLKKAAGLYGVGAQQMATLTVKSTVAAKQAAEGNEKYKSTFDALGVSVTDSNGKMRNSKDILFDTLKGLEGVTNESDRTSIAYSLFGRQALSANQIVAGGADTFKEQANTFAKNTTATTENADAIESMNDSMSLAKDTFSEALISIVASMAPYIQNVAEFISTHETVAKILVGIAGIIVVLGGLYLGYAVTMAGLSVVMGIYNGVLAATQIFTSGWTVVTWLQTIAQWALNTALLPIIAIILGIVAVIAVIILSIKNWGAIVDWIKQKWEEFKNKLKAIWDFIKIKIFQPIGAWINKFFVEPFKRAIDGVKSAMQSLKDTISNIWEGIKNIFKGGINFVIGAVNKIPFVNIPTLQMEQLPEQGINEQITSRMNLGVRSGAGISYGRQQAVGNSNIDNSNTETTTINKFEVGNETTRREVIKALEIAAAKNGKLRRV